jgi:putative membrane protein
MLSETLLPYCGAPPMPGELLTRFNLDPVLLFILADLAICHLLIAERRYRGHAVAGWMIATMAFVSPLCALSVALFSARIAQHMILILVAAPLIASGWPIRAHRTRSRRVWVLAAFFFVALWFWHMPLPYDATFSSTFLYWLMHATLSGSAILLWRELLHHAADRTGEVLAVGALTSMQMGLLGAVLTFAGHPMFLWHLTTTAAWNLTALHDQELGGVFMWVPGILLFLLAALRSLDRLWVALESERAA